MNAEELELIQHAIENCEDQAKRAQQLQRIAGIEGNREAAGDWGRLARSNRRDVKINMQALTRLVKVG